MIIRDPLYGTFEIPSFLDQLVMAPEVRRLMGVRLLNAPSPSLPTLSEIRRFSHTLGVLHLALLNPHVGLTREEVRALAAAILIHDAATPPFAHLLEYYLKDRGNWNHEAALPDLLTGHHFAGNTAHQIMPGEALKFERLCKASKIDFRIVLEIVRKKHRSSNLLFGSLDFDNLDNVLRMAWALGVPADVAHFVQIARELAVTIDGEMLLSSSIAPLVKSWAATRRAVYEILVFDPLTVATQAVLTKAIRLLFDRKDFSDIVWANRDQDLVDMLSRSPETKELMLRNFNDALPTEIIALRVEGTLADFGLKSRDEAIALVEHIALNELGIKRPFGYAFIDKSIFSKRLSFIDPSTRKPWATGEGSRSVVFYCFASEGGKRLSKLRKPFRDILLKTLGGATEIHVGATSKNKFAC